MPVIRVGLSCLEHGCPCPVWMDGLCSRHWRLYRMAGRSLDVLEVDSDSPEFEQALDAWRAA